MQPNENNQIEYENKELENLLKYPNESKIVDYKNSEILSKDNSFTYKLIKHIIGFANSGGGHIVIGYKENDKKIPVADPVISDDIINSYDVSTLAQMIESFVGTHNKIDLKIYKIENPDNNKIYPIIRVNGFDKNPYFCIKDYTDQSTNKQILKKDSLYTRIASARTIELATPEDWEKLIDQAVSKKQDDLLFRFKGLLKEVGLANKPDIATDVAKKNGDQRYKDFLAVVVKDKTKAEGLTINHHLTNKKTWIKDVLMDAMESAKQKNTGWPIGTFYRYGSREHMPEPLTDGIQLKLSSAMDGTYDFWKLYEDGQFLFFRNYQEDLTTKGKETRMIWFDTRMWRIIEAIKHTVALYKALDVDPTEVISLEISHLGIDNRELTAGNPHRMLWPHKSKSITEVVWKKEVTLDDLMVNSEGYAKECSKELFLMFDYLKLDESVLDSVIQEYNQSRVG